MAQEASEDDLTEDQVADILDELIAKKLMVREGNKYLSLAVMTFEVDVEKLFAEL